MKMHIDTKELAAIFGSLHDAYDVKIKQGDVLHDIIGFTSCVDDQELEFYLEIQDKPLDDKDLEIISLKKENKCLVEKLKRLRGEKR